MQQVEPATRESEQLLTVEEAQAYLVVGKSHLYGLIRDGSIPSFKVGRRRVFRRWDLDEYIRRLAEEARD